MPERRCAAQRHELLRRLRSIATPTTSATTQSRLVATLYDTPLSLLEECLLQVCHVCLTVSQPGVQELLCAFMLWLAGCSLHVALRLSWAVDAVSSFYRPTGLATRIKGIQDSIESFAINQVSRPPTTMTSATAAAATRQHRRHTAQPSASAALTAATHVRSVSMMSNNSNNSSSTTSAAAAAAATAAASLSSSSTTTTATRVTAHDNDGDDDGHLHHHHDHGKEDKDNAGNRTATSSTASLLHLDSAHVLRKEARLKMYNDERVFVTTLTDMSHALRCYSDRQRRKEELQRRLHELNARLRDMRLMHPLGSSDDAVAWIVHIAVSECTVFSSHTRAPFRLTYEVLVDDTATMRDPTRTTLRLADGRFRVHANADAVYVPRTTTTTSASATTAATDGDNGTSVRGGGNDAVATHNAADHNNDHSKHDADDIDGDDADAASYRGVMHDTLPYLHDVFGESTHERAARVRRHSPWGAHPRWQLRSLIVKAGDDLRQEELALQLIALFDETWRAAGVTCALHPYRALSTSADGGLLEVVDDAMSVDSIKKACGVTSLYTFFVNAYDGSGSDTSVRYRRAQQHFVESMAAYSVVSYILQIKDRHNGNLLLTRDGALVHIDFGYLIATSPGGLNFESAPFKLSQELLDIMGGGEADAYGYYKVLVYQALDTARACADDVLALLALMVPYTTMPCFGADPLTSLSQLRSRFRDDLPTGADLALYVRELIVESVDNWRTRRYDQFQTLQNGIL